MPKVEEQ
jgi:hypothetical protein